MLSLRAYNNNNRYNNKTCYQEVFQVWIQFSGDWILPSLRSTSC